MSKYFIPATATDPGCPTAEGEELLDKLYNLQEALDHLNAAKILLANARDVDIHFYNKLVEVIEYVDNEGWEIEEELQQ